MEVGSNIWKAEKKPKVIDGTQYCIVHPLCT